MAPRLQLHSVLTDITEHVYFQPPTNIKMEYPCIIYKLDGGLSERADNRLYRHTKRYQVTVVDRDPDSALPILVQELPMCEFDTAFTADNLNHFVFTLFF